MPPNPGRLPPECEIRDEHGNVTGYRAVHVVLFGGLDTRKALAAAWRCDAFSDTTFGEFLKFTRVRLDRIQPRATEISVSGKRALGLGHNGQYVQFVWPGKDVVLNAHPLDVLPERARPLSYRSVA